MEFDAAQARNFTEALAGARDWALERRQDPDAVMARVAFALWTEGRGYNWANDGRNTSGSPGVTPAVAQILRRSLTLPHDAGKVGSNGRSTGPVQQISADVGGAWGDMAGTMVVSTSVRRMLDSPLFRVSDDPVYRVGDQSRRLSDPIAADVLRVQQPLLSEAMSSNYDAGQVELARQIVARFAPPARIPNPPVSFLAGLLTRSP